MRISIFILFMALFSFKSHAQCATSITDNTQILCGVKIFNDGASIWSGMSLRGGSWVASGDGNSFKVSDSIPESDTSTPSFFFQTGNQRNSSPVFQVRNLNDPIFTVYGDGNVIASQITVGGGNSGTVGLASYQDRYLVVAGRHPNAYWYPGKHGAVQVQNENPMNFGFPFEIYNAIDSYGGVTNTHEGHKLLFGHRGQIASMDNTLSDNLPVCDGTDNFPGEPNNRYGGCIAPSDGGSIMQDGGTCHDWYRAVGPPKAITGAVFVFVRDVGEGCQCVPGQSSNGWVRLSNRQPCVP